MVLQSYIVDHAGSFRFNTKLESRLSGAVIRELVKRLMNKQFSLQDKFSIKLSIPELLVLNVILPQVELPDTYSKSVILQLYLQIDKFCLSYI
ncbi:MAG: hypothetical protein J0G96_07290 [Flavobacteriia bacterium]|nr:hypothetical protein [Flavobacteriia bacterium]